MTQESIEALRAEVARLRQAENERQTEAQRARLAQLPPNERPLYERQMALDRREQELNDAAAVIMRHQYSQEYFIDLKEFDGLTSRDEMQKVVDTQLKSWDPQRLEQVAALKRAFETTTDPVAAAQAVAAGAQPAAGTPTPEQQAAGATATPAGVGTLPGGGTSPVAPSAVAELNKEFAGKGATSLAEWLQRKREIDPAQPITWGDQVTPAPVPVLNSQASGAASPDTAPTSAGPVTSAAATP